MRAGWLVGVISPWFVGLYFAYMVKSLVSTIALLTQEITHQVCCVRNNSKLLKDAERFHQHPVLDDFALHNAGGR